MRRIVTSKIIKIFLNTALTITLGVLFSLMLSFGSRAEQTLHTSNDTEIPSGQNLTIDQDTTIVIDQTKTIGEISFNGDHTLTIQGNDTDELRIDHIIGHYHSSKLIIESGRLVTSSDAFAIAILQGTLTIKGGYVSATASQGTGIDADNIEISGGEVVAKGPAFGIVATKLTISGGKVYGEVYGAGTSTLNCGIGAVDLMISGGEITAKSSYTGSYATHRDATTSICTVNSPILTGMKITEPENGAFELIHIGGYDRYLVKDGDNKMVTVVIKKGSSETNTPPQKPAAPKNNSTDNKHTHSYSWVVTKYPTSTSDGEEAYMCSCGEIDERNILPAISAFEEEVINKIKNAPANGVIEVETRLFNSFGIGVRDALVARPDVTLKVSFLSEGYKGQLLKVTIPAGIDRKALFEESGWLGLCWYGSTHGYDQ